MAVRHMRLAGLRWDPEELQATSDRLEKIVHATLKRNLERPPIDFARFDPKHFDKDTTRAFAFFVRQVQYLEDTGAENLALMARYQTIASLRAAYCAQVQDERAHGGMLARYADLLGAEPLAMWQPVLGTAGGKLLQHDPWSGSVGIMMMIEFYASRLLDQVRTQVDEPVLQDMLSHILVDEHRHRALAIEATRLMHLHGHGHSRVARARLKVVRGLAQVFFVQMIAPLLDRYAPMLGLDGRALYDEAREDIDRELLAAGTPV